MFMRGLKCLSAALLISSLLAGVASAAMPEVGDKPPGWKLTSIDGRKVKFPKVAKDGPAVLFFWANWCPYCKALMPRLQTLKDEFADMKLEVYSINFAQSDASKPADNPMTRLPFVHFFHGDDVALDYDINTVPALFIVDKGRVVYRLDYPPRSHPSQNESAAKKQKIPLLAEWWEDRLRGVLLSMAPVDHHPAQRVSTTSVE